MTCAFCGSPLATRRDSYAHNLHCAHNGERSYNGWGSPPFSSRAVDEPAPRLLPPKPQQFMGRRVHQVANAL